MGENSFAYNSLTEWNFQIVFFYWWIKISIVQSSRKIRMSISKNKGVEIYFDWYQIFLKKLKFLNLFSYRSSKLIQINTRMKRFYSLRISFIFSKCISLPLPVLISKINFTCGIKWTVKKANKQTAVK